MAPTSVTRTHSAAAIAVLSMCVTTGCAAAGDDDGREQGPATDATTGTSASPTQDPSPEEQPMSENDPQADRDAIVANFRSRQRAMVDGDTEQLRRLSTPDSHAQHISGYNQPRDEWFDQIESGYFDYHTVDDDSIDLTMTGPDSATLVSRSTIDVTIGGSRNTWRLESTADYVKVDGRWLSGDGRSQML